MSERNPVPPRSLTGEDAFTFLKASSPESFAIVLSIARAADSQGGVAYLVWWAARDALFGIPPKDFDLEIHNLPYSRVKSIVSRFGSVFEVWKSFWVLKLVRGGAEIDVALPRRDSKSWPWHRGFSVETDPGMGIVNALRRRDFTLNSIAFDVLQKRFHDPFWGISDIDSRILRITDARTFADDPLRVYRALQFVSRFGLTIEPESSALMNSMLESLGELPKERIWEEWKKLLLKSDKPSLWLVAAKAVWLVARFHPELDLLENTPQDPHWHPEGNVWTHTLLALDEAAASVSRLRLEGDTALVILLGTLCHDLGKPSTTDVSWPRITSRNHEAKWEAPTRAFLSDIGAPAGLIERIVPLVTNHLAPSSFFESQKKGIPVSDGAVRRLAKRLHPATVAELVTLSWADFHGRGEEMRKRQYEAGEWLMSRADAISVVSNPPENAVSWKELIEMWFAPGKDIGEMIAYANSLRDDEGLDKAAILSLVMKKLTR